MARRWTLRGKINLLLVLLVCGFGLWWLFADPVRTFVQSILWWAAATVVLFVAGWLWIVTRKRR